MLFHNVRVVLVSTIVVFSTACAHAQTVISCSDDAIAVEFFVPFNEQQTFDAFSTIFPGNIECCNSTSTAFDVKSPINKFISMTVVKSGTIIYWDHWEDGYETDISNPTQSSTLVWGDNDPSNGIASGYATDVFFDGSIVTLLSAIELPNTAATIEFDAMDKFAATSNLSATVSTWANGSSTLLAGATTLNPGFVLGKCFEFPMGENADVNEMFEYTGGFITAYHDGTIVSIDADNNGVVEKTINLDMGASYLVPGGINLGATIKSNKDINVTAVTGDICANFESRWFSLIPQEKLGNAYITPVSTPSNAPTYVHVYNPNPIAISIDWELSSSGIQLPINIPSGNSTYIVVPNNDAARFSSDENFYLVSTIDSEEQSGSACENNPNKTNDWGYSVLPESILKQQVLGVPFAPGQDPSYTGTSTENSAPVWLTPAFPIASASTGEIAICIDYNGDGGPLTDTKGNSYDITASLEELETLKIYDPDGDQTGMSIWVCDGSDAILSTVWGQDPNTASGGSPAIDVGTSISHLSTLQLKKYSDFIYDGNNDGLLNLGDTLQFCMCVENIGKLDFDQNSVILIDDFPDFYSYIPESSYYFFDGENHKITDNVLPSSPNPFDEDGWIFPSTLNRSLNYIACFEAEFVNFGDNQTHACNIAIVDDGIDDITNYVCNNIGCNILISSLTANACNQSMTKVDINLEWSGPYKEEDVFVEIGSFRDTVQLISYTSPLTLSVTVPATGNIENVFIGFLNQSCEASSSIELPSPCSPAISLEKSLLSSVEKSDGSFDLTYQIIVENTGDAPDTYSLDESPQYDDDVIINSASFISSISPFATLNESNLPWKLTSDQIIVNGEEHIFTLNLNVELDFNDNIGDDQYSSCQGMAGNGLFNVALIENGMGETLSDTTCAEVPSLELTKTIKSISDISLNCYSVQYVITVENFGGAPTHYNLFDAPMFDDDFAISNVSFVSNVPSNLGTSFSPSLEYNLASNQAIDAMTKHTYTISYEVCLDLSPDSLGDNVYNNSCDENTGGGLANQASLDQNLDGIIDQTDNACFDAPYLTITKTLSSSTIQEDGSYNLVYAIQVRNIGGAADNYDLFDYPQYDDDINLNIASFSSNTLNSGFLPTVIADPNGWQLASDQTINPNETHDYTLVLNLSLNLNDSEGDNMYDPCDGMVGNGIFNSSSLDVNSDGVPDITDTACGDVPALMLEKSIQNISPQNSDDSYDISYMIAVSNNGGVSGVYDLFDYPQFDDDILINTASFTSTLGDSESLPQVIPINGWSLKSNQILSAGSMDLFIVNINVTLNVHDDQGDNFLSTCDGDPTPGQGLFNSASIDVNNDGVFDVSDEVCGDLPLIQVSKSVASVVQNTDLSFTIDYAITVSNTGGSQGSYSLDDTPRYDDDITMISSSFTSDIGLNGLLPLDDSIWKLATDQLIDAGDTHTFYIIVSSSIDLTDSSEGDNVYSNCDSSEEYRALKNEATIDTNGDGIPNDTDDACIDLPYLVMSKTLSSVEIQADGSYELIYQIIVENEGGLSDSYTLYDLPQYDDDIVMNSASFTSNTNNSGSLDVILPSPHGWILASDEDIDPSQSHTYYLNLNVSIDLDNDLIGDNIYSACNGSSGNGIFNTSALDANDDGVLDIFDSACGEVPILNVQKNFINLSEQKNDGSYDLVYTIMVSNYGGLIGEYELRDLPQYDDDIAINYASYTSTLLTGETLSSVVPNEGWTLNSNQSLDPGDTDIYTLMINVSLNLNDEVGDNVYDACDTNPLGGQGLFNQAFIDTNGDGIYDDSDNSCGDLPAISIRKEMISMTENPDLSYTTIYEILVSNTGGAIGSYDLWDTPLYDDDLEIISSSFSTNIGLNGTLLPSDLIWNLADDQSIDSNSTHVYTVIVTAILDLSEESDGDNVYINCDSNDPNKGVNNVAIIDTNNDGIGDDYDNACADLDYLVLHKQVIENIPNEDGTFTLTYEIIVENQGGRAGLFDLFDAPDYDDDLLIEMASFSSSFGSGGSLDPNSSLWELTNDRNIPSGETYTFTVTVIMSLQLSNTNVGDGYYSQCDGPGTGTYNQALLDANNDGVMDLEDNTCQDLQLYDLALKMTATEEFVFAEDTSRWEITVYNQGMEPVQDVKLMFYTPEDLSIDLSLNPKWTMIGSNASYIYNGALFPEDSLEVELFTAAKSSIDNHNLLGYAEIYGMSNMVGQDLSNLDMDSYPDTNKDNDIGGEIFTHTDDLITDNGLIDEDDHDPAKLFACPDGLSCKGHLNVSLDENCQATITAAIILSEIELPLSEYSIIITDVNGNVVDNVFEPIDLGQTFFVSVSLSSVCDHLSCWGEIFIEDKFSPTIVCVDEDLACNAIEDATDPVIMDNCGSDLILLSEVHENLFCDPSYTGRITKTWQAVDAYGNVSNVCTQVISLERIDLGSVVFPLSTNINFACDASYATDVNGHPDPSVTGVPMYLGNPLFPMLPDNFCNGFASYTDEVLVNSSCHTQILREWQVGEWYCSGIVGPMIWMQLIDIKDLNGPTINCPSNITLSTSDGFNNCEGTVSLPSATVSDNCSNPIEVDVTYPGGFNDNENGGTATLPVGDHLITYTAYDACGNSNSCTMTLTIADETQPIAICEGNTVVSIKQNGTVVASAESFDDGSYDNCGIDRFEVRRMTDACGVVGNSVLGQSVTFCCLDVGTEQMLQLRVYDAAGNYTDCMINVAVQDKIEPVLTCPGNMTVPCTTNYDLNNLDAIFGVATVSDNCQTTQEVMEVTTEDFDQCGTGTLLREFSIISHSGLTQTCTQVISFTNNTPILASDITWPADYEGEACGVTDILPADLPAINSEPILDDGPCDLVAFNYVDDVFNFVQGDNACFKIVRTWTVIDWCQPIAGGFAQWTHQQVIKINETSVPQITSDLSTVIVETLDAECMDGQLSLMAMGIDACTSEEDLVWSYEIDADGDGIADYVGNNNDLSGEYPIGNYEITWRVTDGCGNFTEGTQMFEVVNVKPPTAVCINGLSTQLLGMDTDGDGELDTEMVLLNPSYFDGGSAHVCGYPVTLSFDAEGFVTELIYDCDDIGIQNVALYVTDINGNQSFCETFIEVIDDNNVSLCNTGGLVSIEGQIENQYEEDVEEVKVNLTGDANFQDMTGEEGEYGFGEMPMGGNYVVVPEKNDDVMNGVSTLDLVLIQKHILGLQSLSNPYDLIAADINRSEEITALDLIELRKVILGIYDEFPNNTSWRFIDGLYSFNDPDNPWLEVLPEQYEIDNLSEDMEINFVGVKTGDVNGSVETNLREESIELRSGVEVVFEIPRMVKEIEGQKLIPVYGTKEISVDGFQLSLDFNGKIENLISGALEMSGINYFQKEGKLNILWYSPSGLPVKLDDVDKALFYIALDQREDIITDKFSLSSDGLNHELYVNEKVQKLLVNIRDEGFETNTFRVDQNVPNPWSDKTYLHYSIPEDGALSFKIYNAQGQIQMQELLSLEEGNHILEITKEDLKNSGVYLIELQFKNDIIRKKMIYIE